MPILNLINSWSRHCKSSLPSLPPLVLLDRNKVAGTLTSFILLMVVNPSIQLAAQEELDRVCPNRLVTFADRSSLPYVESVIMEVCRYHPVAPVAVPHRLDEDDVFEGKRIPKGSYVLANVWYNLFWFITPRSRSLMYVCRGMAHDENVYPSPFTFNPERFMKDG